MSAGPHVPLSPPMYAVLLTLGGGTMHGYGIIQEFEARTGQEGVLLPGSLYNTIARMMRQGLIEEVPAPDDDADPRRRYYRATALGRDTAADESTRLRAWLALADGEDPAPA